MDTSGIFEALRAKFGKSAVYGYEPPKSPLHDDFFFVAPKHLVAVARHLRDEPSLSFDFLECLSGVDYPNAPVVVPEEGAGSEVGTIHTVYHLRSYTRQQRAVIKVSLPRSSPKVDSLCSVWSAAQWHERETYDLLGVVFEGHPDLRRVLMPDDWVGHPLRKDYQQQDSYNGIPTSRPDPLELVTLGRAAKSSTSSKGADHG